MQQKNNNGGELFVQIDRSVTKLIFPFIYAVAAYLVIDKINTVEQRIKRIEEKIEQQIEMKFELQYLRQQIEQINSHKQTSGNGRSSDDDSKGSSDFFYTLPPDETTKPKRPTRTKKQYNYE